MYFVDIYGIHYITKRLDITKRVVEVNKFNNTENMTKSEKHNLKLHSKFAIRTHVP